jgi:N4-gp56 family major capsid protein
MAFGSNHTYVDLATGSGPVTAATRARSNSAFIRELWTDEIIAAYKSNLVMPQLVVNMPFNGRKGDTFHVPNPVRGGANEKLEQAMVTLQSNQESKKQYLIDQHYEYSRLIEDIVSIQADDSLRRFYTDDAGYALAKQVDTHLHAEGAKFAGNDAAPTVEGTNYSKAVIGSDGSTVWNPAANTNAGNAAALADDGIREIIRQLDDNDVPNAGRVLVIPPVEKKSLTGIARFTEQAFTGEAGAGNTIRNGLIGNLYGVDVYVSTNCPTVADGASAVDQRAALMFQKEALVFIEQMRPRVQTSYIQEYLGDLFTADTLYGKGVLRPEAGVAIVVPA